MSTTTDDYIYYKSYRQFNPLVPGVQNIEILNSTLNLLLIVEFVEKMALSWR